MGVRGEKVSEDTGSIIRAKRHRVSERVAVVGRDGSEELVHQVLNESGHRVIGCPSISELVERANDPDSENFSVIVFELDAALEDQFRGLDKLMHQLPTIPVVVVSNSADVAVIVRVTRLGVSDYVIKNDGAEFTSLLAAAVDKSAQSAVANRKAVTQRDSSARSRRTRTESASSTGGPFLAVSPMIRNIKNTVSSFAGSDVNVLIRGESGTGKGVIANYIHESAARSSGPFVKLNCAALPEDLLESELFGYEKGAFTGATERKLGKFETAEGGTLLLDEISETSPRMQAKLLHVLQDKTFTRLGGNQDIQVDVQVLVTTNRVLEVEVEKGTFREDLYFRLKVIDLLLPPLRERREEIPLFVDHFLAVYGKEYQRAVPEMSDELLGLFMNYRWPGNIRELENLIRKIVLLGDEGPIVRDLRNNLQPMTGPIAAKRRATSPAQVDLAEVNVAEVDLAEPGLNLKEVGRIAARAAERQLILFTLNRRFWNQKQASRDLGVSYKTLLNRMKELKLRKTAPGGSAASSEDAG